MPTYLSPHSLLRYWYNRLGVVFEEELCGDNNAVDCLSRF